MIIDIKKFVNELKGNQEFDVENTIRTLEGHVTAVVHNKVTKAELHAEAAKAELLDKIASHEMNIENLQNSLEESKNSNEGAVAEAKEEIQAQLDAVSQELASFKKAQRNSERQTSLNEVVKGDLLEDALILANAKGLITDEMTSEEVVEAMTKFVEDKPMFKFTTVADIPENNPDQNKGKEDPIDPDSEIEKMKKEFFSGKQPEKKKEFEYDENFNEDDAINDLRKTLGM